MDAIFLALAPVFGLIMLGHMMRKYHFPDDAFWPLLERVTFYVLLPCLFIKTMATADLMKISLLSSMLSAILLISATMALMVIGRKLLAPKADGPSYSSIIQGATRFNNYVGLPVTLSLYGQEGLVVYAFIIAALIPITNITSVWALAHYASHTKLNMRNLLHKIATNPLIVATLIGIALSLTGIGLPPVAREIVVALAAAGLPMGLIAIGAGLNLGEIRTDKNAVSITLVLKLLFYPALALGIGLVVGLPNLMLNVLVLFAALPTATTSYILASQMNGNSRLMANIVASETLAAFVTMPLILWLMMAYFPL